MTVLLVNEKSNRNRNHHLVLQCDDHWSFDWIDVPENVAAARMLKNTSQVKTVHFIKADDHDCNRSEATIASHVRTRRAQKARRQG